MGGFNQVTLAWRPAGTEAWTALGTDDNAPYRVFHDVTGLAKGSLVEYRAVLRDHSGNLSVAQTYATVGDPPPPGGGGGGGGGPVMQPDAVSVPGTANDEMGCTGEWQPECDEAQLTLDLDDQIWKGTYDLPAGEYFFKVAINRSWTENYGAGAVPGGADIRFTHPGGPVTFYYDHGTHWVTNDVLSDIITAPGSAQSELGCAAQATGGPTACDRGCRTPTATERGRGRRPRSPPVRTRSRSPMTCRGTRTMAPAAHRAAATSRTPSRPTACG